MSLTDPLMYGPAVRRKRVSSIRRLFGLASMYPALYGAFVVKAVSERWSFFLAFLISFFVRPGSRFFVL